MTLIKSSILATAIFFLCFNSPASAQVIVGNGGDLISCRASAENQFEGFYFLDYVVTYDRDASYIQGADPTQAIVDRLGQKLPQIATSLNQFLQAARTQISNGTDWSAPYIWFSAANGVATLRDEDLDFLPQRFPSNCMNQDGGLRSLDLFQIIHHIDRGEARWFKYDPEHMDKITGKPLQFSYMIVHEWLWKYATDAFQVRDVNQFLHTTAWHDMDSISLHRALVAMGLNLSEFGPVQDSYILDRVDYSDVPVRKIPVDPIHGVSIMFYNRINKIASLRIMPQDFYVGVPRLGNRPDGPVADPIKTPLTLDKLQKIYIGTNCRDYDDCAAWKLIIELVPLQP